jgi:hypothetical protein
MVEEAMESLGDNGKTVLLALNRGKQYSKPAMMNKEFF